MEELKEEDVLDSKDAKTGSESSGIYGSIGIGHFESIDDSIDMGSMLMTMLAVLTELTAVVIDIMAYLALRFLGLAVLGIAVIAILGP
eukprot:968936-Alexandrium_andersonii.AAC.1